MKKPYSRFEPTRRALIFWVWFIGLGALAGSTAMLIDPAGRILRMDAMLPYFQVLPLAEYLYQDFTFPGIALLCVNGIPNLVAAVLLHKRKKAGILLGGVLGITLMAWIGIQFYIFPLNFMSTIYFVFGLIQALTGMAAWIFYRQEQFQALPESYPNIGQNGHRLVVYFSRMGYTRKAALEEANRTGAAVYEIQTTERTAETLGFWWCGRFGMHRWPMSIRPVSVRREDYDHVTICAPIWVFHLAAPVRAFCQEAKGRIREADYILVHHQKSGYRNAAREMDTLLGLRNSKAVTVCCRQGRFLCRKVL